MSFNFLSVNIQQNIVQQQTTTTNQTTYTTNMTTPMTPRDKRAQARSNERETQMTQSSVETPQEKTKDKQRKEKLSKVDKKRKRTRGEKVVQTANKQRNPSIRCNLQKLVAYINQILSQIPKRYMETMMKTPFGILFNAICSGQLTHGRTALSPRAFTTIMSSFDSKDRVFNLGGKKVELKEDDFALIFGLPKNGLGLTKKAEPGKKYVSGAFAQRIFPGVDFIKKSVIENAIMRLLSDEVLTNEERNTNEDCEDFARLIILQMVVMVFMANANQNVGLQFVDNLDDFDNINNIRWASIFHQELMEKLCKCHSKTLHTPGPVIAVNYWFCEHTTFETPSSDNVSPRCVRWNITDLLDGVDDKQMQQICKKKGVHEELLLITDEEKLLLGEARHIQIEEEQESDEIVAAKNLQRLQQDIDILPSISGSLQEVVRVVQDAENQMLKDEIENLKKSMKDEKEIKLKLLNDIKELEKKRNVDEQTIMNLIRNNEGLTQKIKSLIVLGELKKMQDTIEVVPFKHNFADDREYIEFEFAKPPEIKEKEIEGSSEKCKSMIVRLKTRSRQPKKLDDSYVYYTTKIAKPLEKETLKTVEAGQKKNQEIAKDQQEKEVRQNQPSFDIGIENETNYVPTRILNPPLPPKNPFPEFDRSFLLRNLNAQQMAHMEKYFKHACESDLTFDAWNAMILCWYSLYITRFATRKSRRHLIITPQASLEQKKSKKTVAIQCISEAIAKMPEDVDLILVPINSGQNQFDDSGYHWTLLAIDLVGFESTHYNSLDTKNEKSTHYYTEASHLAHILINEITKSCKITKPKMQKMMNVLPGKCQKQGSYPDCGVYVCEFMERLINREKIMARTFTIRQAQQKRALIAYLILATPGAWNYEAIMKQRQCQEEFRKIEEEVARNEIKL